jgi:hypothetical protein
VCLQFTVIAYEQVLLGCLLLFHALFEREREDALRRTVSPILQSSAITEVCT